MLCALPIGKAVLLAQLAYQSPDVVEQAYTSKAAVLEGALELPRYLTDADTDLQAYIVRFPDLTAIAVRGTSTLQDAFCDLQADMCTFHSTLNPGLPFSRVHCGMFEQYCKLETLIKPVLDEMTIDENEKVVCLGHSLGAAIATMAAVSLSTVYPNRVSLYGFGSPRVGDAKFKAICQQHLTDLTLVKHSADPVVKVMVGSVYQHVAEMQLCGGIDFFPSIPSLLDLPDHAITGYVRNLENQQQARSKSLPERWLGLFFKFFVDRIADKKREAGKPPVLPPRS